MVGLVRLRVWGGQRRGGVLIESPSVQMSSAWLESGARYIPCFAGCAKLVFSLLTPAFLEMADGTEFSRMAPSGS